MEDLQPQELEDLVQELGGESGKREALSPEVEELLRDLQQSSLWLTRLKAARDLGEFSESDPRVVQALIAAGESDSMLGVREAAVESLHAPAHQEILQEYPDLMQRARSVAEHAEAASKNKHRAIEQRTSAAPQSSGAEMSALSIQRPGRFRVETQSGRLSISWKDKSLHLVVSAGLTLLLLLLLGYSLIAGGFSDFGMFILALLVFSGYWLLVASANSTQIIVSSEQWVVEKGPLPFPSRRFYLFRQTQFDPAAYREIWAARVEQKRQPGDGRGTGSDLWILELLVLGELILDGLKSAPGGTYSLYARARDGADKLLLTGLEGHEADYLKHTLQDLLDVAGGPAVQE